MQGHGIGNRAHRLANRLRQPGEAHGVVQRQQRGERRGEKMVVVRALHRVAEVDPPGGQVAYPAADPNAVVVARGLAIADGDLADNESKTRRLELPVAHPARAGDARSGPRRARRDTGRGRPRPSGRSRNSSPAPTSPIRRGRPRGASREVDARGTVKVTARAGPVAASPGGTHLPPRAGADPRRRFRRPSRRDATRRRGGAPRLPGRRANPGRLPARQRRPLRFLVQLRPGRAPPRIPGGGGPGPPRATAAGPHGRRQPRPLGRRSLEPRPRPAVRPAPAGLRGRRAPDRRDPRRRAHRAGAPGRPGPPPHQPPDHLGRLPRPASRPRRPPGRDAEPEPRRPQRGRGDARGRGRPAAGAGPRGCSRGSRSSAWSSWDTPTAPSSTRTSSGVPISILERGSRDRATRS